MSRYKQDKFHRRNFLAIVADFSTQSHVQTQAISAKFYAKTLLIKYMIFPRLQGSYAVLVSLQFPLFSPTYFIWICTKCFSIDPQ